MSIDELREARTKLAKRKRRIIANNDGCDCLYYPGKEDATPEGFLKLRTTELADTHVDTIAYCTISSGFGHFTHNTKVGTVLVRQSGDYGIHPDKRNATQEFIDQGKDVLQLVTEYGHAHGMEVLWSMRMNDTHDVAHTPEKPYLLFPTWKEEHPDWLVGDHVKRTPRGRWSSVNYAVPEVRDLAFGFIDEVCRSYDVDGVELDFFRHLCYFPSVANGGTASDEEREMMTGLMRRVRAMTEAVGVEKQKPLLVCVRVTDSVEFNRDMGLDIEQWLKEGLVDLLATTCYFRLNPWSASVELGHKYGVRVYPCLSDSRMKGETRFRRSSYESYRGRAMNAWAAGADGLHVFNHFNPRSSVWRELGDHETLRTQSKLYFVTVRDGSPNSWLAGGDKYRTIPMLGPSCPVVLTQSKPLSVTITVGDDVDLVRKTGWEPSFTCHLSVPRVTRPDELSVKVNGRPLTGGTIVDGWLDLSVPAGCVKQGENEVEMALVTPAAGVEGQPWSFVYEGTAKPDKPWTRDPGSERTEERLEDGALFIADRGTVSGDYHYYRYPWGAAPGGQAVVEARVKVVSGSSFLIVANGASGERLGLWPDHIDLFHNTTLRYDMDTTDDYHTYRLVMDGEDLQVFVDGELRISAPGGLKPRGAYRRNEVCFGAANSGMLGEAYWQSVKARLDTQSCNDLVISVTYAKRE